MSILATEFAPIGFSDRGTGPALVFVHGFLFEKRMWQPQIDYFVPRGYRVICVDMVGFGDSATAADIVLMAVHSRAVAAVLDACSVDSVVLIGNSMGGQVAPDFADRRPKQVAAVVLSDTFVGLDPDQGRAARLALPDRLANEGVRDYTEEFLPLVLSERSVRERPAVADRARAMMADADPAGAAAALRGRALRSDYTGNARRVSVAALVVVGAEDSFDRGVLGTELAENLSQSQLRVIAEAGHTPSMEGPDAFNTTLSEFLYSVPFVNRLAERGIDGGPDFAVG
ncbi:alpha/beta fold hydrolase [Nocardia sp. NPDC050412]|uniref:alpha/beta fold hydrolase n=1 Tax=Nocardia sp. NPDC050412 TaxID=3364320 RepID=UPI0037A8701D